MRLYFAPAFGGPLLSLTLCGLRPLEKGEGRRTKAVLKKHLARRVRATYAEALQLGDEEATGWKPIVRFCVRDGRGREAGAEGTDRREPRTARRRQSRRHAQK